MRRTLAAGAALLALLAGVGCGAPVGVRRQTPLQTQERLERSALTSNVPSDGTASVLRRHHLAATWRDQPELALTTLRPVVLWGDGTPGEVFALAELSFLHARRSGSREYALAAALYAYAFLFPGDRALRPSRLDSRVRQAADIYAAALVQALRAPDGETLALRGGEYPLPFGRLTLAFDESEVEWSGRHLTDFVPTQEFAVSGLQNRYRQAGIGVPLAGRPAPIAAGQGDDLVADAIRVPATAVLRLDRPRQQLAGGDVQGRLDILAVDTHDTVVIDGLARPLEVDRSATLALTLAETAFWRQELANFFGDALGARQRARLLAREPYRPGRIPVVLVHGTRSSPGRFANLVNDLEADPRIRARYQFWFFTYDSGSPITFSSMLLRRALVDAVARFDPDGTDPALQQMVLIGHSQGGLLARMAVIEAGSTFWDNVSATPLADLDLSPATRALIEEALFVSPLPFVSRVIFIATPHRGSALAAGSLVRRLAARLISMPRDLLESTADLFKGPAASAIQMERLPTAIDNMSPNHPFILTLAEIPVSPDVAAHSIIAVQGFGPLEQEDDGVVAWRSAHLEGVASERIVRGAGHSVQHDPRAIDEVRRILLLHAAGPR